MWNPWITFKHSTSYTALEQSDVSCNHLVLGHVIKAAWVPLSNDLPTISANSQRLMLLTIPSGSGSCWTFDLTHISPPEAGLFPLLWHVPEVGLGACFFYALPKIKIYTYINNQIILCSLAFPKVMKRQKGFILPCCLAPSPSLNWEESPFPQETKFSSYYSEQLSSPSPLLWCSKTLSWSQFHYEPSTPGSPPTSIKEQKEVLNLHSLTTTIL